MPQRSGQSQKTLILILSGCLLTLLAALCLGTALLAGLYLYRDEVAQVLVDGEEPGQGPIASPLATPSPALVTAVSATMTATPLPAVTATVLAQIPPAPSPTMTLSPASLPGHEVTAAVDQPSLPARASADLTRFYSTDNPVRDYFNAARGLGYDLGERTFKRPLFQVGDRQLFRTDDGDVEATLVAITPHAYFWVDDWLDIEDEAVQAAAERLEEQFYGPLNHLFDKPWEPGIDGDPRFSVLHLAGSGSIYELGYFSDQDEYPRTVFRDSNEQEIIYLNMGQLEIGSDLYFGTLVHELQHLFQWNLDKNEATWLNEGISQLAELYVGLDTASPDAYLEQPHVRLDRWEYEDDVIDAHYGNSFLFTVYLWEQLGEDAVYELVRHPANGLAAVQTVLRGFAPERTLEGFLAAWAAANFLDDPAAGEAYSYTRLDLPRPALDNRVRQLPFDEVAAIDQLGVHYVDLDFEGPAQLTFSGGTTAPLTDGPPPSGEQMWYAIPANDTDATLMAAFDLRGLQQATLTFQAWYDLEDEYDFAYIAISTDQGARWNLLSPTHQVAGEYGPALTGQSAEQPGAVSGWVQERVSLDNYAGQEILLRFQVLTDFESLGRGFALDDLAIPELAYLDDVEGNAGIWSPAGFVQTGWLLPQQWSLQLIHGGVPRVEMLPLDGDNSLQYELVLGPEGGTLVIMPIAPYVSNEARYRLRVAR